MANRLDDDGPGSWNEDLERRLRRVEAQLRSGRITIGRFVVAATDDGLVVTNTESGETTTLL